MAHHQDPPGRSAPKGLRARDLRTSVGRAALRPEALRCQALKAEALSWGEVAGPGSQAASHGSELVKQPGSRAASGLGSQAARLGR